MNIRLLLLNLSVLFLLFLGNNVLFAFGYNFTSIFTSILPSFYLLILLLVRNRFRPLNAEFKDKKEELLLFIIAIVLLIIQILTHATGFLGGIINLILLPPMFSYIYPVKSKKYDYICRKILTAFYIINSLWAIAERLIKRNIFPFTGAVETDSNINYIQGFRSTALQDHPLNNALCLTVIMVFILSSKHIQLKTKLFLYTLGYLAVLCFNTRSSIILWSIIFFFFLVHYIYKENHKYQTKIKLLLFICILIPVAFYFIEQFQLGDRIRTEKLLDDSAMVRIESLYLLLDINLRNILLGMPPNQQELIMYHAGVKIIENFWIVYLLRYGIIGFSLIIFGFSKLLKRILANYTNYQKYFCLLSFLLLASTNNSLSVNAQPLCIFILCSYAWKSPNLKMTNKQKRIRTEQLSKVQYP